MSSCRRLLLQVHAFISVRRFSSIQTYPPYVLSRPRLFSHSPLPRALYASRNIHPPDPDADVSQLSEPVPTYIADGPSSASERSMEVAHHSAVIADLSFYEHVRKTDPAQITTMPLEVWLILVDQALAKSASESINHLAEDLLFRFTDDERKRLRIIRVMLWNVGSQGWKPESLALLLEHVVACPTRLAGVPRKAIEPVFQWFVSEPVPRDIAPRIASALSTLCVYHLGCMQLPTREYMINYRPPMFVPAVFSFIRRLLRMGDNLRAFELFQLLVKQRHIPPEGLQGSDPTSEDFAAIILSAFVRSSLHWGWRPLAAKTLLHLFNIKTAHDDALTDLAMDTLFVMVDSPAPADLRTFVSVILALHARAPGVQIPSVLIRKFYDRALDLNMPDTAEEFYGFARSKEVRAFHQYPPPQGLALAWFMRRLTLDIKNVHLCRELVQQVMEDNEPIILQFRPTFVLLAAINGLGLPARRLWVRYAVGRDRDAFVGHPRLMLRMTSLFAHLSDVAREKLEALHDLKGAELEERSDSGDIEQEIQKLEFEAEDYMAFTTHILAEYVRVHTPLANAHHHVLTSLARAYFIAGRFTDGFAALKYLMDRKEIPDLYDINVVLSALAEQDPRAAARMIERMIEKGVLPDAVTFGTVIYHALEQKETSLVANMIRRARSLNGGRISMKTVSALIRSSIGRENESVSVQRDILQHAYNVLSALRTATFSLSPSLGRPCVLAALRVDHPRLAYMFWLLLLKDKTQWDDHGQKHVRRLILRAVIQYCRRGDLDAREGAMMAGELSAKRPRRGSGRFHVRDRRVGKGEGVDGTGNDGQE